MDSTDLVVTGLKGWKEQSKIQEEMYSTVLYRNAELEARVAELEDKVDLLETGRRDLKARLADMEAQLNYARVVHEEIEGTLQRRISAIEGYGPIALCLLDGDGCVFSPTYICAGEVGGINAAMDLKKGLLENCGRELSVCTFIYLNQAGLREYLVKEGVCSSAEFNAFVSGFNQSTELFCIIDVGYGKEAADAKIREMLKQFAPVPQVKKVVFGGGHDGGYRVVLNSLRTNGHEDKLVMLDYGNNARAIDSLNLPQIMIPDLFRVTPSDIIYPTRRRLSNDTAPAPVMMSPPPSPLPVMMAATPAQLESYSNRASTASPPALAVPAAVIAQPVTVKPAITKPRLRRDPSKPMIHQKPTICNDYHLSECLRYDCHFSHDYELTEKDVIKLRAELKQIPCKGPSRGCRGPDCRYRH